VLALTGYVETVGAQFVWQSDLAIAGIIIAFSIVPAAFIAVSLVTFRRYRLRKVDIDV
jgi:glycoside/pentoside/hexuronide:cation symporter, GPH family